MSFTPSKCPKCGTTTGGLFTVCPVCKHAMGATVTLFPGLSHAQALATSRALGMTLGETRAAFAQRDPEAA